VQVEHIGQPGGEEQAATGVAVGLAGELALAQFEHRQHRIFDGKAAGDALEQLARAQMAAVDCVPLPTSTA